ncbi:hypothetical protein DFQ27_003403 [Actinomortierella ambigua]|uniref:C2H2-type domain-containing protein n=1 Tax=Actinomortierella ambigua TaxID=1343610 RepID=A0A9P6Q4U8_9FUNG|nr:hypothetical protein DFQ27_003403 [Actinomortierella ambigua]
MASLPRRRRASPSDLPTYVMDLLNFDTWLLETTSTSSTPSSPSSTNLDATSSFLNGTATPASTALSSKDGAGFDQLLSPLYNDASSLSASNTPWTPYLDTPDPSPFQTPLFGYSNSEDSMRLDQLLMPQVAAPSGCGQLADVSAATTQDASTDSLLQAEPSLLDFVLFDDLATLPDVSPVSTTPLLSSTTATTPASTTLLADSTEELALQLVVAAAANLASAQSSSLFSPLSIDGSLGEMSSLFQDSCLPAATTTTTTTPINVETALHTKNNCFHDATLSSALQMNSAATMVTPPLSSLDELALTSLLVLDNDFAAPLNFGSIGAVGSTSTLATLPALAPYHPAHPVPLFQKSASVSMSGVTSTTTPGLKRKSNEEHVARALSTLSAAGAAHSCGDNNNNNNNGTPTTTTPTSPESSSSSSSSADRPFVCGICGRAFSRLFNLNTHKITHDRVKARQFNCSEPGCKKAFTRKNDLQRHQITIHGVTHRFDCRDCKRPFARRDTLQRHLEQSEACSKDQLEELDRI